MVTPGDLPAYRIGGCLAIVLAMSLHPNPPLSLSFSLSIITSCYPVPSCLLQRDCNVKLLVNNSNLRAEQSLPCCRVGYTHFGAHVSLLLYLYFWFSLTRAFCSSLLQMILKRCKIHVTEGSLKGRKGEGWRCTRAYFSILNIDKHVDGAWARGRGAAMPGGLLKVI